jgi:hypothetical protein
MLMLSIRGVRGVHGLYCSGRIRTEADIDALMGLAGDLLQRYSEVTMNFEGAQLAEGKVGHMRYALQRLQDSTGGEITVIGLDSV